MTIFTAYTQGNYKRYRDSLGVASTPCVPYVGVFLKDLTFICDGNPDYLRGGLINLHKRRQVRLHTHTCTVYIYIYIYNIVARNSPGEIFHLFAPTLVGEIFYPANLLSHINNCIESMAIFTAWVKIYSTKYFCNARVAGFGGNFYPRVKNFSCTVDTIILLTFHFLGVQEASRSSPLSAGSL